MRWNGAWLLVRGLVKRPGKARPNRLGSSTPEFHQTPKSKILNILWTFLVDGHYDFHHLPHSCAGAGHVGKSKLILFPCLSLAQDSDKWWKVPKPFTTCPNPASSSPSAVYLHVTICRLTVWPAPLKPNVSMEKFDVFSIFSSKIINFESFYYVNFHELPNSQVHSQKWLVARNYFS